MIRNVAARSNTLLKLMKGWKKAQKFGIEMSYTFVYLNEFKHGSIHGFGTQKESKDLLKSYEQIRKSQKKQESNELSGVQEDLSTSNNDILVESSAKQTGQLEIKYNPVHKIRCEGCNTILQSKDKTKYGYITQKILQESIEQNSRQMDKAYGQKAKSRDSKILGMMHEVEKQLGIKIFNEKSNKLQNLTNLQVLMRLQQKIDRYEEGEQLLHRQKKQRKQILCFRCFSLKHHNRLPQQYDSNEGFTMDTTEFILNKVFNRHKGQEVEYFYMVDALDILGTFQEWLFKRLIQNQLQVTLVVNKIDVMHKDYLNESALHNAIKLKLKDYLKAVYAKPDELTEQLPKIKIYYVSCTSRDGIKKLKEHMEGSNKHIQLMGYPNTGKTTLLNILSKIRKSTSRVPGTTIKVTEHEYGGSQKKIYDMPGLFSEHLLYNLVEKPSVKSMLTWHKKIAPGLLTNSAFLYGARVEIPDTRIIVFGHGGACSSGNKWFIGHRKQFWKALPEPKELNIKKHEIELEFVNGRTNDLEIAGYGFIGFRLCIPNVKKTTRKLVLYLPEKVQFGFRPTVLSVNDSIFHNKSALTKKFMLERLTISRKSDIRKDKSKQKRDPTKDREQESGQSQGCGYGQGQVQVQVQGWKPNKHTMEGVERSRTSFEGESTVEGQPFHENRGKCGQYEGGSGRGHSHQ